MTIGLVGKYVQLHDAYLSVAEALRHAGYVYGTRVDIQWIDSETITRDNVEEVLGSCDGILVPGGFGNRGIEGKIAAAHYARTHNIPYLGICLGMQIAVIEFARSVCGLADANSGEFDEGSTHKVIDFMPDQSDEINKGGTLRLGAYPCHIVPGTKMAACYGTLDISERHRHRYEFNNDYRALMQEKGARALRPVAGRPHRGDRRDPRERLLHRRSVPSRVQEPPEQGAPPVQGADFGGAAPRREKDKYARPLCQSPVYPLRRAHDATHLLRRQQVFHMAQALGRAGGERAGARSADHG